MSSTRYELFTVHTPLVLIFLTHFLWGSHKFKIHPVPVIWSGKMKVLPESVFL